MTEIAETMPAVSVHTSDAARARLNRRYAAERRFRLYGLSAVCIAGLFLVILLWSVIADGWPAFILHKVTIDVELDADAISPDGARDAETVAGANFNALLREALRARFAHVSGRNDRRALGQLISSGAPYQVQREVTANPDLIGTTHAFTLTLSDTADLYLKGEVTAKAERPTRGIASPTGTEGTVKVLSTSNDFAAVLALIKDDLAETAARERRAAAGQERLVARLESRIAALERDAAADERVARLRNDLAAARNAFERLNAAAQDLTRRSTAVGDREDLSGNLPSILVYLNGGVVKASRVANAEIEGEALMPLASAADAPAGGWRIVEFVTPENERKFSDKQVVWTDALVADGVVDAEFNADFFTNGASREAELAGIGGAAIGSAYTMLVTLLMSFPLGVAAAIYLEEFAPKNRWTHLIEVNINNLAAVPSIVFGLLGLAVFLGFFGLPRSAPLVGGMVLALMTLPTIIIAARAALRAVPPSIREGALGVGASRIQSVFDHVLPLAMPGILTGTIIGMAQALGETAPLLMIGMVAFIVDIPGGPTDPATVLPVQIYMWSDFPERAFTHKTAAAIMVLLGFLMLMNALAVFLRKRFERRW